MDETRWKLLDAAGHEFAEKGFEGATVRSICERAGANLAAVNYHFGDKERLYEAAVLRAHEAEPSTAEAVADQHGGPRAALRRFVASFLAETAFHRETAWHHALMLREIASPSKASETLIREAFQPRFEGLLATLRELAPGLDSRQLHAVGFSVIGQCLHYKLCRPVSERIIGVAAFGALDHAFLADHIARFTLAALGQGEPLNGSMAPGHEAGAGPMGEG